MKHSTQNALVHLTDTLAEKLDNSETAIVVFLDLAKAFETVDHQILLEKLKHYGIRGIAYDIIKSYLTGRKQCVKCGNCVSTYLDESVVSLREVFWDPCFSFCTSMTYRLQLTFPEFCSQMTHV